MKPGDPYGELPKELKEWGDLYYGGSGPLEHAKEYPDQWSEAFLLTIFEVAQLAVGIRRATQERPWAVRYDSDSGMYLAYPLRMLDKRHGLMATPHPWHHLYRPILCAMFRPLRKAAMRAGDWIAILSDMASQVVDGLWQTACMSRRVA